MTSWVPAGEHAYRNSALPAVSAVEEAAEKGDSSSQARLGDLYADGTGVPQNYAEAIRWYCRAAAQGFAPAASRLYALGIAGRPGADDANSLQTTCGHVLRPSSEIEDLVSTDRKTKHVNAGVTIRVYSRGGDACSDNPEHYYGYTGGWRVIKPHPPVHRPMYRNPPIAIPAIRAR
jgi:TPR repeat protein